VYEQTSQGIVSSFVTGINGTIIAYGQTSSGKTFTMQGPGTLQDGSTATASSSAAFDNGGIVHMAACDIFNHIENEPERIFLVRVSFIEIYNEEVRDLLVSGNSMETAKLKIREDKVSGVFVNSNETIITSMDSLMSALFAGEKNRTFAATAINERSSRSHTIFRITVESHLKHAKKDGENDDGEDDLVWARGAVRVSTLNLVDLAGSESVRHTGATGDSQKEGGIINKSLLFLSLVIESLGQKAIHVNFRDSKLTRILQPSLSGNARIAIICCVTPSELYLEETRSTLQFASRAKLVKTKTQVNEIMDDRSLIKKLERELNEAKGIIGRQCAPQVAELQSRLAKKNQEATAKEADALSAIAQLTQQVALERLQCTTQQSLIEGYAKEVRRLESEQTTNARRYEMDRKTFDRERRTMTMEMSRMKEVHTADKQRMMDKTTSAANGTHDRQHNAVLFETVTSAVRRNVELKAEHATAREGLLSRIAKLECAETDLKALLHVKKIDNDANRATIVKLRSTLITHAGTITRHEKSIFVMEEVVRTITSALDDAKMNAKMAEAKCKETDSMREAMVEKNAKLVGILWKTESKIKQRVEDADSKLATAIAEKDTLKVKLRLARDETTRMQARLNEQEEETCLNVFGDLSKLVDGKFKTEDGSGCQILASKKKRKADNTIPWMTTSSRPHLNWVFPKWVYHAKPPFQNEIDFVEGTREVLSEKYGEIIEIRRGGEYAYFCFADAEAAVKAVMNSRDIKRALKDPTRMPRWNAWPSMASKLSRNKIDRLPSL